MEALKLYLDKANCVFVMGVEPSIIEAAITLRYGVNSNLSASMYLEKIVQIPIAVPRTRSQSGLDLISSVAGDLDPEYQEQFKQLIRIGMDRNPRRIKRVTNAYIVAVSVAPESSAVDRLALVKVLLVQMRFPDFYHELTRSSDLLERLQGVDDEHAWIEAGVGSLYKDLELRRFLQQASEIPAPGGLVRRWIRVTEAVGRGNL